MYFKFWHKLADGQKHHYPTTSTPHSTPCCQFFLQQTHGYLNCTYLQVIFTVKYVSLQNMAPTEAPRPCKHSQQSVDSWLNPPPLQDAGSCSFSVLSWSVLCSVVQCLDNNQCGALLYELAMCNVVVVVVVVVHGFIPLSFPLSLYS